MRDFPDWDSSRWGEKKLVGWIFAPAINLSPVNNGVLKGHLLTKCTLGLSEEWWFLQWQFEFNTQLTDDGIDIDRASGMPFNTASNRASISCRENIFGVELGSFRHIFPLTALHFLLLHQSNLPTLISKYAPWHAASYWGGGDLEADGMNDWHA